jgi:hypothetical protein
VVKRTVSKSIRRAGAGLLVTGLVVSLASVLPAAPGLAAPPVLGAPVATVVGTPTTSASPAEKFAAASAIGVNPDSEMMLLNDQAFVLALWRAAKGGTYVKAEALRAYDSEDADAAVVFIRTGIFAAAHDDAQVEIIAEQAKARRRSVAVIVGLDPRDTALIEKSDRDFIFAVWQRAGAGTKVRTAAEKAIAEESTAADWEKFLDTGAQVAAEQDLKDAIEDANEEEAARLRAAQLATAKRALLQLLLLPVTEELVNAPNRQYILQVHAQAKGPEVQLAAQQALNAPDATLDKALSDFIFTGGAAANARDEQVLADKEREGYRTRVVPIRDAARKDGFQPQLVAAAEQALADNTVLALQYFLLKGQDEARARDRRLDLSTGFEPGDTRPNWANAVDTTDVGAGGVRNVGAIVSTVTGPELGIRADPLARTGTSALMYSGKDTSDISSWAYLKAFTLTNATVRPTSTLSYWIYPQSAAAGSWVNGNSTCVAVDMVFADGSTLRGSGLKDQRGRRVHPAEQCGSLTPDTWNEVTVPLGALAGKKLLKVDVGYDQAPGLGGYRGFVDDLKISDLDSAPKFRTSAEAGEPALTWTNSVDSGSYPHGGLLNVGPLCCDLTGPELKASVAPPTPRTGTGLIMYSGKDTSDKGSYAYTKAYSLGETYVTRDTKLSYWIYPQSKAAFGWVTDGNSSCVGFDLLLQDQIDNTVVPLRATGAKDQYGNPAHPGSQCGKLKPDAWNFVSVNLGAVANGKRITQIAIGYDQKAATGGYRGMIDDIRITQ